MRGKRPKMRTNECVECGAQLVGMAAAVATVPVGSATIAVCESCGHLIVIAPFPNRIDVRCATLIREWFVEQFDEEERARARTVQEGVHHKLGQWG